MSEVNNKTDQQEEIDLLGLFRVLGRSIRNFFLGILRTILLFIVFLYKKAFYVAAFFILGVLVGWGVSKMARPYYASDMVVRTNAIKASDIISYVDRLHNLVHKKNYHELGNLLSTADSVAFMVKNIQAFWFIDVNNDGIPEYIDYDEKYNPRDTTVTRLDDRVDIRVEVFDPHAFEYIREGVYTYFKKNPYINQLNNIRKIQACEIIKNIDIQINKLDSLEDYEYFKKQKDLIPRNRAGQIVVLNEQKVQLYHPYILSLQKQKLELEKEISVYPDPITVIEDFTPLSKEENPRMGYIEKYALIMGLFGILLLLILESRRKIRRFLS
jgi:hypothetical protein